MQTEQNSQGGQAAVRVPEHLKGTRQGIFHLLSQSSRAPRPHPMPSPASSRPQASPEARVAAQKPEPVDPWQVVLQADNFIFSD